MNGSESIVMLSFSNADYKNRNDICCLKGKVGHYILSKMKQFPGLVITK